jgi:hypothetical protein
MDAHAVHVHVLVVERAEASRLSASRGRGVQRGLALRCRARSKPPVSSS